MIGECSITYDNKTQTINQKVKGRFTEINFDKEITLECGNIEDKQKRYEQLLISMLTDQWKWIKDHNHKRIIDGRMRWNHYEWPNRQPELRKNIKHLEKMRFKNDSEPAS